MLCAARAYPPEHAGQYELPGGKVEPGEAPQEALARELMEEMTLTVRLGREIPPPAWQAGPASPAQASWPILHGHRMRVWLAEPCRPHPHPRRGSAHRLLRWVPLGRVLDLPWLSVDVAIIERLLQKLDDPQDPL